MADPVVTEITDVFAAFIAQLRNCSDIVALTGTQIGSEVGEDWTPGSHGIMVREVGGSNSADVRHQYPRYDVWCLGSNGYEAKRVFRRVQAWLMPAPTVRAASFKIGNCVVYSVLQEGGQSRRYPTAEEPWYAVIQAYRVDASEVPL